MAKGFEINQQGIRQMSQEIEREFAKHPIKVPIEADAQGVREGFPGGLVVHYNAPVVTVHGDHAQIAWGNDTVHQGQTQTITPGYEGLADVVTQVLALIDVLGLDDDEAADARDCAHEVLEAVTAPAPDRGIVRRGVTALKGVLAAAGSGVTQAVTAETAESARHLIEQLGNVLPG